MLVGFGGWSNLTSHWASQGCRKATALLKKGGRFPKKPEQKNVSLIDMFARTRTKLKSFIPSTVTAPAMPRVENFSLTQYIDEDLPEDVPSASKATVIQAAPSQSVEPILISKGEAPGNGTSSQHSDQLEALRMAIQNLPASVPEAEEDATTTVYASFTGLHYSESASSKPLRLC